MKKFFTHLLLLTALFPMMAQAGIRSITDPMPAAPISIKEQNEQLQKMYNEVPNLDDADAVKEYLKKRLKIVTPANMSREEATVAGATSVVDTNTLSQSNEKALSAYEKIYQDSLNKADNKETLNQNIELDGTFYREVKAGQNNTMPPIPDFPYVTIKLSDKKEILAPAEEHIAYLLTSINIEPNGLLRVTEEFVFVSNNDGFPQGFFRILPKYSYSRNGSKRRLNVSLESVTVNGEEYPYKITEIGDHLHIEPIKPLGLPTGIYTYKFNYLIDRAVWFHKEFDELYWDITARTIKNVIGSANAMVILPTGKTFMAQNAIVSTATGLNFKRVTITSLTLNSLGFADTEALGVGDDIHVYITLEKGVIVEPDLSQKFMGIIQDYGNIIFALLAFLAIFISYRISDIQMRRNQDKTRVKLKRTPSIFRLINANIFDARSFAAEILNLTNKNIIEIKENDSGAVLIKKTDNLKILSKTEQAMVRHLFPGTETTLPASAESRLKLIRAYDDLKRSVFRSWQIYKLKLNGLYLIFSISMLIFGIIGAATIAVNPLHTFIVIICTALIMTPFVTLIIIPIKKKWLSIILKLASGAIILGVGAIMAIYTSNIYAGIIIASIYLIIWYYRHFSRRNGLLKNKIKETEDYKNNLYKNMELETNKKEFNAKKPYIWVFGLEEKYPNTEDFRLIQPFMNLLDTNFKKGKDK